MPYLPAPIPSDDPKRLAYLRGLGLNFRDISEDLEALARLASCIAETPMAFVSFVEEFEQNIVANVGLAGMTATPRDMSLCGHAIMSDEQMVVVNTANDVRFSDNPLVTGNPSIGSYVGSVLKPEPGRRVGTLCVADKYPRQYAPDILAQIDTLANVASFLIRAHSVRSGQASSSQSPNVDGTPATIELQGQRSFRHQVAAWLDESDNSATLVILDADQFKLINDRFGHNFGDEYLAAISRVLATCMPADAILAHNNGDEFAAFIPEIGKNDLDQTLLALRTMLRATAADFDKPQLGKLSIGTCSTQQTDSRNYQSLHQSADVALTASKDKGLNSTTHFCPAVDAAYNIGKLQARFLDALDADRVIPYFQPVLELSTGRVRSFEALVRWNDPDRGLLTPAAFTKMLTDRSAGPLLTQKMIDGALHAHDLWRGKGMPPVRLAINLTERDLVDPSFVPNLDWKISESGFEWHDFTFEVTETVMLGNVEERIFKSMSALRARGAKIALDDFGTGYAGLVHLRDWPISSVKIDQKFVKHLASSDKDHVIVQMVLELADRLDLQVCAEGIEDAAAAKILADAGCDFGQGYHFSPPLELNAALAFLQDNLRNSKDEPDAKSA